MSEEHDPRQQILSELSARIGHEFRDPQLLERALVHSSMTNEGKASYERLEFLGDAILGFVVADHLFRLRPEIPEGELTDRRARIVAREPLASVGRSLGLATYAEVGRGIRQEELDNPRLLADLVEALLGAIYLDGGIRAARRFVRRHVLSRLVPAGDAERRPRDPKSRLLHWAQAHGLGQPVYEVVATEGPDHALTFTVTVRIGGEDRGVGTARNKRAAEMEAAATALRTLREQDVDADRAAVEPAPEE